MHLCFHLQWRHELNLLKATGCPVTPEEALARYQTPPPGQNAWAYYAEAQRYFDANPAADTVPIVCQPAPENLDEPLTDDAKQIARVHLATVKNGLEALHRAVSLPFCRFPGNFSQPDYSSEHEMIIRNAARYLALETLMAIEDGDSAAASNTFVASLAVGKHLLQQPVIMGFLMAAGTDRQAFSILYRMVHRIGLTDREWLGVQEALFEAEERTKLETAIGGEFCRALQARAQYASLKDLGEKALTLIFGFDNVDSMTLEQLAPWIFPIAGALYWSTGWEKHTQAWTMQLTRDQMKLAKNPDDMAKYAAAKSALGSRWNDFGERMILQGVTATIWESFPIHLTRLRCAEAAAAIERYRVQYGRPPNTLQDLVPEFLAKLPLNPYDLTPIVYRITPNGYTLECVPPTNRAAQLPECALDVHVDITH